MNAVLFALAAVVVGAITYGAGKSDKEAEIFQACDKGGNFVVVRKSVAHVYSCRKVSP